MSEGETGRDEPTSGAAGAGALALPAMGLGTWAWGDRRTWGMGGYDAALSFGTIRDAYQTSLARGVTLLDTAEVYGRGESERIIGRLLAEARARGDAEPLIATKFMPYPWRLNVGSALAASLRASLARLQSRSVALYQLHGPISLRSHAALADALAVAYGEGLFRAAGVSNYSERELRSMHRELSLRGVPLLTNQVEFSLLRNRPETTGLLAACRELGVRVLAYSPLGQGRLTGKYSVLRPPPGGRHFGDYSMSELEPLLALLATLGAAHGGKTPGQVALNWLLQKGAVPIPGAKNRKQAEENAGALGWALTPSEVAALDAESKPGRGGPAMRLWQHG